MPAITNFLPRYSVIEPSMPVPSMKKGKDLVERYWRYDSVSRNIMDLTSWPPLHISNLGVVNHDSLFQLQWESLTVFQEKGAVQSRVRLKDIPAGQFAVRGIPPMGVLPVGTVLYFYNDKNQVGNAYFKEVFGDASFANKLKGNKWVVVDNINANAQGIVAFDKKTPSAEGGPLAGRFVRNQWGCTYRIQRLRGDRMDWDGLYTANKDNLVDIQADALHELLRMGVEGKGLDEVKVFQECIEEYEDLLRGTGGSFANFQLVEDGRVDRTVARSVWLMFLDKMNDYYFEVSSQGCVKIVIPFSQELIRRNSDGVDSLSDYWEKVKPHTKDGLLPYWDNFLFLEWSMQKWRQKWDGSDVVQNQMSAFLMPNADWAESLFYPLVGSKNADLSSLTTNDIAACLQKIYIGLAHHHDGDDLLITSGEWIEYPVIWFVQRWLNGFPSFDGPRWAEYQKQRNYKKLWLSVMPNTEYKRTFDLGWG